MARMSDQGPFAQSASTATLLTDVIGQSITLIKGEVALAKAEAADSVNAAFASMGKMVVAAVLAIAALNMLAAAAVAALLALGWTLLASTLTVALVLIVLALGFALYARSQINRVTELPQRALRRMGRDVDALKELVK
jgi:uncharacterized membrane protein